VRINIIRSSSRLAARKGFNGRRCGPLVVCCAALALLMAVIDLTGSWASEKLEMWPIVTLGEEPIDNIPSSSSSNQQSGSRFDVISLASFGASVALDSHRRVLALDYLTDAQLYARNSQLDEGFKDQYVGLRDYERVSKDTSLLVDDTFIKGTQVFGLALIGPGGASPLLSQSLLQRNALTNSFDLQLIHRVDERLTLAASTFQSFYSVSGVGASQSFNQGMESSAYYKLRPQFSLGPAFEFQDFRFSSQPRAESYFPAVASIWQPMPSLNISGKVGPLLLSSPSTTRSDVGYKLRVSYVHRRLLMNFDSGRTPSITAGFAGAGINQFFQASSEYGLGRWTSAYINSSYYEISGNTNTYVLASAAGISHRLTPALSIFGQYLRYQTNSSASFGGVTNAGILGVSFSPQPWSWTW
jgi:hypothetical protein